MLHCIKQLLPFKHVNVQMMAGAIRITVEQRHQIVNACLRLLAERLRNDRERIGNAVETILVRNFGNGCERSKRSLAVSPCIGFAPGAKGSPAFLPSGVLPVFLPYTTFDVIVSTDIVGNAPR